MTANSKLYIMMELSSPIVICPYTGDIYGGS